MQTFYSISTVKWMGRWVRPCSEGFSPGTSVFLPQQKPTRSLFELAVGCAPRSCMDRTAAASGAYICFRSSPCQAASLLYLRGRLARQLLLLLLLLLLTQKKGENSQSCRKKQFCNIVHNFATKKTQRR